MIDIHCHLLPKLDDGPYHIEESLALARMAWVNGIEKAVVTPHIYPGRYDNDVTTISPVFSQFQYALQENNIPLQISMAAEVRIDPEIIEMVEQNLIPFVGFLEGYQLLLLELPYHFIPLGSDKLIRWLLERNIRPIIAHPERNGEIVRHLEKVYPFLQLGCLLQITAGALVGHFGFPVQQCAQQLLERGWVDIIASDAHDLRHRLPDLEAGRVAAAKIVGESLAWVLVHERPEQITQTKFIEPHAITTSL